MNWLPSFNEGVSTGIVVFLCVTVGWLIKYFAPVWKRISEAKAKKIEAESELAESMQLVTQQQADLLGRTVGMLHDHGVILGNHSELLKEIVKQVNRESGKCKAHEAIRESQLVRYQTPTPAHQT